MAFEGGAQYPSLSHTAVGSSGAGGIPTPANGSLSDTLAGGLSTSLPPLSSSHDFLQSYFGNSSLNQMSGSSGPPPFLPLQIPALSRLTEGNSILGVSPRNIYNQPPSPKRLPEEESEEDEGHADGASSTTSTPAPAPNGEGEIYAAVYSGIPVYEMMCNSVAVMRRKSDGFLNATQILKVAGVDKGKRTKILDKEVMIGEHEKVQGGYGKYQGTWIPFERGVQLAAMYGVDGFLRPLLEFELPAPGRADQTPTKEQVMAANRDLLKRSNSSSNFSKSKSRSHGDEGTDTAQRRRRAGAPSTRASKRLMEIESSDIHDDESSDNLLASPGPLGNYAKKRPRTDAYAESVIETNAEKYRAMLMAMFVHEDPLYIPDMLSGPTLPNDLDLDIVIDEQSHTSLHWAAALARINVVRVLLQKGADIRSVNNDGETALIRAVRVTNNYDNQTFPELLDLLHSTLVLVDAKNRTVLHHIAATAGLEGRVAASRYYLECLLEWVARHGGNFSSLVDIQDSAGDTALNVAARIGNRNLVEQLIDVGADGTIENRAGLRPSDFGFEDILGSSRGDGGGEGTGDVGEAEKIEGTSRVVFPSIRTEEEDAALALSAVASATKGREIASAVQQMVDEMSCTFSAEMKVKADQLTEARNQLRQVTKELADVRKQNHILRKENQMLPEMVQQIKNLERCLGEEMAKCNTTAIHDQRSTDSTPGGMVTGGITETKQPPQDPHGELAALRRTLQEKEALERSLRSEIIRLKSTSGKSELGCKKIIAACCNVPVESVDELLNPLLQAVESDKEVDMSAVAGFMMDVKRREGGRC
ncbi:hypothetical protein SpCBS45565_g05658 [Spizellomyces sp. 'palustris']|nr:hypothetical protein SpCBS45565_g05658 [Spizellomyces sp. 'palustris']